MRAAWLILLAGCYRSAPPSEPLANKTEMTGGPTSLTMSARGVGPINSTTKVTLTNLRSLLVGYEVKPVNDGSLQYDIFRGGERLAYVVPDDQSGYVFNIHAVSSTVVISGHPWRVGRVFGDAQHLTSCECWGPHPTCYATGDHMAVNFNRDCDELAGSDPGLMKQLNGEIVQRVIWSPTPFGEDYEDRD